MDMPPVLGAAPFSCSARHLPVSREVAGAERSPQALRIGNEGVRQSLEAERRRTQASELETASIKYVGGASEGWALPGCRSSICARPEGRATRANTISNDATSTTRRQDQRLDTKRQKGRLLQSHRSLRAGSVIPRKLCGAPISKKATMVGWIMGTNRRFRQSRTFVKPYHLRRRYSIVVRTNRWLLHCLTSVLVWYGALTMRHSSSC